MNSHIKNFYLKPTQLHFKNLKKTIIQCGLIISSSLLLTTTSQASEVDSGFYAGFGLSSIATEDSGASSQEMGATVIGGYEYSQHLSAEISLFTLGDHKALGMKGNGLTLSVIGSYPIIENINLFAELGVMSVDIAIDEQQNIAHNSSDEESLQDGIDTSIYLGVGAKYKLTDWTLVLKVTAADLDADVNIISAQAHYHF
ncbi:hypothetical protein CXF85_19485 [Colwellia sp. 75C3]|uniref:outer membrane beta-barrel protein n=1 Tax=Colwellia sp. 75C3 TaxID=888425 RepID=UPI000C3374B0|nr:outer membrane beta-barrel protein [Colwellia sp. 75C3]PKG80954.1 hypothetical protein CXF85_19485 [Colwellia sp. 75C3]